MQALQRGLLAGVAALAFGCAGAAVAQTPKTHVMTVRMPDGGVAQIRYTGDVAPRVSFGVAPAIAAAFAPMPALFGPDSPFAALDRISAEMDRQAAATLRQADRLAAEAQAGQLTPAALQNLPPGSQSYTFVSTRSGNNFCSKSIEITRNGEGPPQVVRRASGNCGGTGSVELPTTTPGAASMRPVWTGTPAPAPKPQPNVVWTSAHGGKPYAGLVQPIPPAQR